MTDRRSWLAEEFEVERPHLRAIAYRMLGSLTEADDAVQEAWVRLDRKDPGGEELRGWLTVVVGRICLDLLRARRAHRVDYQGSWLPEPIVSLAVDENPEADAVMADSVGLALLVVLDTLTPCRAAVVRAARRLRAPVRRGGGGRRPELGRQPPAGKPCPATGPGGLAGA